MSEDQYVIFINVPTERDNLISEIKSLKSTTNRKPSSTDVRTKKGEKVQDMNLEDNNFMLSSVKKTKGEGKKKKKKNKKGLDAEFMVSGELTHIDEMLNEIDDDDTDEMDDNLIDIDDILYRDDNDDISDGIVGEQKKGYDKRKKSDNHYKKEFAEEMTLLYDLLDETNKFGKDLEKKYKTLESSRARGSSKYTTDIVMSIIQTKGNKLQIIKELSSIKKIIADFKLKEEARNNKNSDTAVASGDQIAAMYLKNILGTGRKTLIDSITNGNGNGRSNFDDDDDDFDDIVADIEGKKSSYNEREIDNLQDIIEQRLGSSDNPFRSDLGSKYIEYENRGVKIFIKRCIDTGDWEFIARDRDGQQVFDYPLPNRKEIGKIKFSSDGKYASDERGRSYGVIEYFSPDMED